MPSRRRFLRDSAVLIGSSAAWASRQVLGASKTPSQSAGAPASQSADHASGRAGGTPSEFDIIIVGAGSSGCVLANRLSANRNLRVLVLEAGGSDADPLVQVPGKWTSLLGSPLDWNYTTEAVPGLGGRQVKWPRGKALGGSSSINAMAYVRGHQLCFDAWAAESGPMWSYGELLRRFRRLEDNSRGASDYHGAGGALAVADTTDPHAGHLAFLEAARLRGFAARPDWDFNGARQENGAGFYQKNIRGGRRHSAAAAFLTPAQSRPNLTVWPETRALKIVVDGRRVTGVEVLRAGVRQHVRATRGVVLAAGAIESPKLLLLSGIGPADAIKRHGLPVVIDLPGVGANLQDHPRVAVRWAARQPLAPSSVSAGLFTSSSRAASARPPDLQFYVGRGLDTPDPFVTLTVALSAPASRGAVTLRSADPLAAPQITPNYFAEPADLEAMVEGVLLAQAIGGASPFAAIRGATAEPDDRVRTRAELRDYIRRTADTIFHASGTCRMGAGPTAVVDPQLRVHGLDGLRVADGSIMPTVVNSQTHAACVVIGDVAAELIGN
jgi:choline dehydrogenase